MFPLASVAIQVTVVVPAENCIGALLVTLTIVQLSVTTGVPKFTFDAPQVNVDGIVIAAGATITGLILSTTVTI